MKSAFEINAIAANLKDFHHVDLDKLSHPVAMVSCPMVNTKHHTSILENKEPLET